jgi:hypothetical protein
MSSISFNLALAPRVRLLSQPVTTYRCPQAGCLQYPNSHGHHHYNVQNHLDAGLHGDIPVDQPQRHTDYDERDYYIYEGHVFEFSIDRKKQFVIQTRGQQEGCVSPALRAIGTRTK